MAQLKRMPAVTIAQGDLARFGQAWAVAQSLTRTPPHSSAQLGSLFNKAVAEALSAMLGGIPVVKAKKNALAPAETDCVEVGEVLVIGSIRPQNYDVGYRPDGVRFVCDSKTLNDTKSIGKNWHNMINDLGTEATNVHGRFPHAVVGFLVALPKPALMPAQQARAIATLERLAQRAGVDDPLYTAEAVALVVWNPNDGTIDGDVPDRSSPLRIEKFSGYVEGAYSSRYKGLPPHAG